jgi:ATPase family associated with various cellular activities (AAA)
MDQVSVSELIDTIEVVHDAYHKLVIFAGPSGSGKTRLLKQVADQLNLPVINLSLKMSEKLLSLTRRQRRLKAEEIARDVIDEQNGLKVCLDNIELLFDSNLSLNPLGFLQDISRNRLIVSSWNGTYDGKHLNFGYRGHPDFFQQAPSGYPVFSVSDSRVERV